MSGATWEEAARRRAVGELVSDDAPELLTGTFPTSEEEARAALAALRLARGALGALAKREIMGVAESGGLLDEALDGLRAAGARGPLAELLARRLEVARGRSTRRGRVAELARLHAVCPNVGGGLAAARLARLALAHGEETFGSRTRPVYLAAVIARGALARSCRALRAALGDERDPSAARVPWGEPETVDEGAAARAADEVAGATLTQLRLALLGVAAAEWMPDDGGRALAETERLRFDLRVARASRALLDGGHFSP